MQSEYIYNATATESVTFESFDASGMSYRSSLSNGGAIVDAGDYESAPGEFDPLGGNAGIETPYVEDPPPDPEPGPLNPNYPIFDDAMMVDGQRVPCTLNGMTIGCSTAQSMLGDMALPAELDPYQRMPGFSFEDRGLGIFTWNIPGQYTNTGIRIVDADGIDTSNDAGGLTWHPAQFGSLSIGWNFGWGVSTPATDPPTVEPPHSPSPATPTELPTETDPCAKKGKLDFSKQWDKHIYPRHVASSTSPRASKYTFWPWQWTKSQYRAQVESFGQETFENGIPAVEDDRVVYTYAFFGADAGDHWAFREVGIDGLSKQATNVNTVVVNRADCQTVITSHPGLPWQFGPSDIPGAIFKSGGLSTQHRSPF